MIKNCQSCKKDLPRDNFYKLTGKAYKPHWDCRSSMCKQCATKVSVDRLRAYKRDAVLYKGGVCADCNLKSEFYAVYDFHHSDPNTKEYAFGKKMKALHKIKDELDKCELLCANCHRIRHYKEYYA